MSTDALAASDRDLRRPFLIGVLGVVIIFVLLGGLIAAYGSGAERPSGVAERWLVNVADTTRKGVRDGAHERAAEVGPIELAADLLPSQDTDGKAAFVDLEVGQARTDDDATRVPFRLHQRLGSDTGPAIDGTLVLVDTADGWRVTAVEGPTPGLEVPSEGGRPAAEASLWLFAGAIAASAVVTVGCAFAVRAAGARPPDPHDQTRDSRSRMG